MHIRLPLCYLSDVLCLHTQVLFFDDESKRTAFVNHLRAEVSDVGQEIRVKETREKELLKEALTKEKRAQIVETFIRHAFSQVPSASGCLPHPLPCYSSSSFKIHHNMSSNRCLRSNYVQLPAQRTNRWSRW